MGARGVASRHVEVVTARRPPATRALRGDGGAAACVCGGWRRVRRFHSWSSCDVMRCVYNNHVLWCDALSIHGTRCDALEPEFARARLVMRCAVT